MVKFALRRLGKPKTIGAALVLTLLAMLAQAQQGDALRSAAAAAIATNPDVNARLEAYRAANEAVVAAGAAYLPRVGLNAAVGRDESRVDAGSSTDQAMRRSAAGVTVTQLLWDGLGTRSDVARLTHGQAARYFELLDATEQVVLEVARAHYDVMRLRRLVQLAEENYVQHRAAYLQIQSRVRAGVGRGVDLEQAGARLALAESNLSAELSGLHDATARYQRIVGTVPPRETPGLALLREGVPKHAADGLALAIRHNAAVSASVENMRAARALVDARRSAYQPRAEARLRATGGRNLDGVLDRTRTSGAEVVLSWNLFNGGADQARVREQLSLLNQAAHQRDRACHETRQSAAIAFNDIARIGEQLVLLERNAAAIEKARDAYRQQFEIGQRSLLDLLNAESERYSAYRAHANAEHDLAVAYARSHASMNQLGALLGLRRATALGGEGSERAQGEDAPARCESQAVVIEFTDRSELDARALRLSGGATNLPSPARKP